MWRYDANAHSNLTGSNEVRDARVGNLLGIRKMCSDQGDCDSKAQGQRQY